MEFDKRKRSENGTEIDGKKVKVDQTPGGEETSTLAAVAISASNGGNHQGDDDDGDADGEVEEFFAILRRIHVAVKYFEESNIRSGKKENSTTKAKATGKEKAKAKMPWNPNFEREDFEGGPANGVKGEETVGDNVGLDLNVEPDSES